jgi:cytidylate kinase
VTQSVDLCREISIFEVIVVLYFIGVYICVKETTQEIQGKDLLMSGLGRIVETDASIDKFVDEQLKKLMKDPKFHELVVRVSDKGMIKENEALKIVMDKVAEHAKEIAKPIQKKSAAHLELILR